MSKVIMAQKAQADTVLRAKNYVSEIYNCIKNSIILSRRDVASTTNVSGKMPMCDFIFNDAVSAAFDVDKDKTVTILSFASYKNPGGGYIRGIVSQEESLCHESYLYNVLRDNMDYYNYNAVHSVDCGYYDDRAILTPNVRFFHNKRDRLINVLACAAPQVPLIKRHRMFDEEKLNRVFSDRIKFVCEIIQQYPTDFVILGAFGCGFHANNTQNAGHYFKTHLQNTNIQSNIIFAFTDEGKLEAFQNGFNED